MTTTNIETPALLGAADAARYMGVGRTKLYELAGSGDLPSIVIGRRRLWRRSDLDAFVESLPTTKPSRQGSL
jgi:excisionase family DNA binding protein